MNIKEFWDDNHKHQVILFLSDYPGIAIWKYLEIEKYILPQNKVLNIGVGTGRCTKDLQKKEMEVYALDISEKALSNVKDYVVKSWLNIEYDQISNGSFDLVISHLVTQHMSDEDLYQQLSNIIPKLKENGIFAMQFAAPITDDVVSFQTVFYQQRGAVLRKYEVVKKMVEDCGGEIVYTCNRINYPANKCCWYGIHIRRKNDNSSDSSI